MDLGLAMLQRWWRPVYAPHMLVAGLIFAFAFFVAYLVDRPWVAMAALWWLKPLNDRVVLHVLARAVFGEIPGTRATLAAAPTWLGTGLGSYLVLRWWPDLARSFHLPVCQLEGQRGAAGRARRALLGRRMHGYAVWLTIVCLHLEAVLFLSLGVMTSLLAPAASVDTRDFTELLLSGEAWTWGDALAYAAAVLLLEPFYVAAGFALYLNRRTVLEGWDIEVALRRIAARHTALAGLALVVLLPLLVLPDVSHAQKEPKREIAEVLKAPEFPHEREVMQWQARDRPSPSDSSRPEWLRGIGYAFAAAARVALWVGAVAALVYVVWWIMRIGPRGGTPAPEPYRPPAALFGMALAPESLPPDVAAAAAALAGEGRPREALGLLYRATLSALVHRRGVPLAAGHTEADVLALVPVEAKAFMEGLVRAWRDCAYARRDPPPNEIERLALGYREFAACAPA